MYRIRRTPPPLRVTFPPPSRTTRALVFTTLAVAVIVMVTGAGPQENVMTPPAATALTTAREVQLAAVPSPTTRAGPAAPAELAAASDAPCTSPPAAQAERANADANAISTAVGRMRGMGPHASGVIVTCNGV